MSVLVVYFNINILTIASIGVPSILFFFMRKPHFIRTWRIYHFPSFLFIGFVSTRLACRRRKKHVSCCKSMCMWKYLLLLSGAYCLEAVRPSCNLHYRQTAKKILKQFFFSEFEKYARLFISSQSVIDVGQGISVGPGRFGKKNKHRALNKRRAWKIWKKE